MLRARPTSGQHLEGRLREKRQKECNSQEEVRLDWNQCLGSRGGREPAAWMHRGKTRRAYIGNHASGGWCQRHLKYVLRQPLRQLGA